MTTARSSPSSAPTLTADSANSAKVDRGAWLALAAALLGWMFDGAEMGVFSMVGRPAIMDLLKTKDDKVIGLWFGVITAGFLVGAATGGVVFGWLGDRIGRVRAMTLSVFTYAVFTGVCGFCNDAWQVGVLRFIAALGMGGEWSLGVALVMEVWPNRSRAFMAGLIGAAANVGYLLVGFVGLGLAAILANLSSWLLAIGFSQEFTDMLVANKGWRIMMILGTLPALLTFFIRIFVPESEKWQHEQKQGSTSNWATEDLWVVCLGVTGPLLIVLVWAWDPSTIFGSTTGGKVATIGLRVVSTLAGLVIATVGYLYPVRRFFQRVAAQGGQSDWPLTVRRMLLGACLSGVALLGTWGSTQWAPTWADNLTQGARNAKEYTQIWLAVGAIIGTILAALMGDWFGRRKTYCVLCVASIGSVYLLFLGNKEYGPAMLAGACFAGICTASFYGWLPLYLPELFKTNVRATGQGFGFNFGRILAAIGVLQTGNLMGLFKEDLVLGSITIPHGYPLACSTMSFVYVIGLVIIWLAPETRGQPLPE
ncbi:MAG TPA: MFS transporter [Pirellulaceae bacterium]|nr:MFS transporter [Pirellulaceae bacterium]